MPNFAFFLDTSIVCFINTERHYFVMANLGDIIDIADAAYRLVKYVRSVKQAPDEWDGLESEVANSKNMLRSLHVQLQSEHFQMQHVQQIFQPLFATGGPMPLLREAPRKIQEGLEVPESKREEFMKALKWPFKMSEVRSLLSQMQRAKSDILVVLNQAGIHLDREILEDTKVLREYNSQAELDKILQSISPHEFFNTQQTMR